ncbi:hypothetical protein GGR54DRAFT_204164 [Hypoxylon sp. NC1633]|nr:hypothetical protein GGR54DRAFT_204164 [Hypoxylon sp. NC1633]
MDSLDHLAEICFNDAVDLSDEALQRELRSNNSRRALQEIDANILSPQQTLDEIKGVQESPDSMSSTLDLIQTAIGDLETDEGELSDILHPNSYIARRHRLTETHWFPQFKRLPFEIRVMIWELAIPRRVLSLDKNCQPFVLQNRSSDRVCGYRSGLGPPSVASVCQESRAVACRSGRNIPIHNSRLLPRPIPPGLPSHYYRVWSWFDPSRDSLRIDAGFTISSFDEAVSEITACTRHVTVGSRADSAPCCHLFSRLNPLIFPHLKAVDFVAGQQYDGSGFPFEDNRSSVVDLDDETAKGDLVHRAKMNKFYGSTKGLEEFLDRSWNELWACENGWRPSSPRFEWHSFQQHLKDAWVAAQYRWYPLGGGSKEVELVRVLGETRPGLSEACVDMILQSFPVIRRVAVTAVPG